MNPDDEALSDLIDQGSQVVRMIAVMRFDSSVTVKLPSGRILTGNEIPEWVERVTRQRLAGPRAEPAAKPANTGWQRYERALTAYVAGTGTLEDLTSAITPAVAARISADEHLAAKAKAGRAESDRVAAAWAAECAAGWAAECAARSKHRHVKHAVALVGAHKLLSFVIALVTALIVVPWSVYGLDSNNTGLGILTACVVIWATVLTCAARW